MKNKLSQQNAGIKCGRRLFGVGLFLVGLLVCLAVGASMAQAQTYTVKNMGMLKGMKACQPTAMNSEGKVVGIATSGDRNAGFVYYYNGKDEEMEEIGGFASRAFGIGPSGIIVGDFRMPNVTSISHAALFNGGGVVDLGVLKNDYYSTAVGINAMRQVVGFSGRERDGMQSHAFIWTSMMGMMDIGTLGGPFARALAINDAGYVTGTAQTVVGTKTGESHAFTYQPLSRTEE